MPDNVDNYLRRQVEEVGRMVVTLDNRVAAVGTQVNAVGAAQQETRSELGQLRTDFLAFVQQAERAANIQRAETKIGALQDQVEHEFGHYKVVRRTAVGMLQAFDVGIVSEETIRNVSEQLMIQTPRYWLAPALVALAAWSGGDRELCDRAIEEAFRRSHTRTSLFFALVLRRQQRQVAANRWLRQYLATQDPNALGRDFAVILEAIAHGAFGAAGRELVQETMNAWTDVMLTNQEAQAAQVARWRAEVESHQAPSAKGDFPRLAKVSPQWPDLDRALQRAGAHQSIVDRYAALLEEEIVPNDRLEDAVDDILDRLVGEYDNEELPLRRSLAYHVAVIDSNGDLDAARRQTDVASAGLGDTLDYLTIQTTSALDPSAIGVSRSTQRLAVAACRDWFAEAHSGYSKEYRSKLPTDVRAVFDSSHTLGAQVFSLPKWKGSFTTPMDQLERSLGAHWDKHIQPFIDSMAFNMKKAVILPAIVVLLILILIVPASAGIGLLAAFLVGGIWAYVIYRRSEAQLLAQRDAKALLEREKKKSITQLRAAGAEVTDWTTRYKTADAVEAQARTLIASLATAGQSTTPYERRSVDGRG